MEYRSLRQAQFDDPGLLDELESAGMLAQHMRETVGAGSYSDGYSAFQEAAGNARAGRENAGPSFGVEAIVQRFGFPSLIIQNGTFEEPKLERWKIALNQDRDAVEAAIAGVGRIEFTRNGGDAEWIGTGWRISDDVIVTNEHVAKIIADMRRRPPTIGRGVRARIDMREEFGTTSDQSTEFDVDELVHIETDDPRIDLAMLRLSRAAAQRLNADPLPLNDQVEEMAFVAAIGYPARDRRNSLADQRRLFGDVDDRYGIKRLSPGRITQEMRGTRAFDHNCTTLGGMSGSPVIELDGGSVVGLHYGGIEGDRNEAVRSEWILDRARRHNISVKLWDETQDDDAFEDEFLDETMEERRRRRRQNFNDRDGYRADFLGDGGLLVPLPRLNEIQRTKVAKTSDGDEILNYRHFSAVINGERRLAYYVAANIDGNTLHNPIRDKTFRLDPRLDRNQQADNALYKHNPLDRGHLIRRLDPCWGTRKEAEQANIDSMFYTNIAPQHKNLNQRIWLDLENHILRMTDREDARISVMVGCVFGDNDPVQRRSKVRVPMAFWKVVASLSKQTRGRRSRRQLQAQAFILRQDHLVKPADLEAAGVGRELIFGGGFETHQLAVEDLERMTGLDFHGLRDADTLDIDADTRQRMARESVSAGHPYVTPGMIFGIRRNPRCERRGYDFESEGKRDRITLASELSTS